MMIPCIIGMVLATLAGCGELNQSRNVVPTETAQNTTADSTTPSTSLPSAKKTTLEPIDNKQSQNVNLVNLKIEINKIRRVEGQLCISIFDSADGWPFSAEKATLERCIPVVDGVQNFEIPLEPNKQYAIAVFHDANSNGDLDKAPGIGIPLEGFGFSTNPPLKIGAPAFEEVAIKVGDNNATTLINLLYLL